MLKHSLVGVLAIFGLLAICDTAQAQGSDNIAPRAGAWGAEIADPYGGATLLKFASPTSAWSLGVSASAGRVTGGSIFPSDEQTNGSVSGSLGHRWYRRASADAHLHPTFGVGVLAQYFRDHNADDTQDNWIAGPYGDFGATWFFTPHVSLGALGRLSAGWGRNHQRVTGAIINGAPATVETTSSVATVSFNAARLTAAVYF